jgi:hypothetical protein
MRAKAKKGLPRTGSVYIYVPRVSSGVVGWNASVLGYGNLVIGQRMKPVHTPLYVDLDR